MGNHEPQEGTSNAEMSRTTKCTFERCTFGRLIFIHHQCWEVLPFCRFQRQRCIKILCPKDPDFYTPLALKTAKGQHLPALVVYKNQSPNVCHPLTTVSQKSCILFFVHFATSRGPWMLERGQEGVAPRKRVRLSYPKNLFGLFVTFYLARLKSPCKVKITRETSILCLV